MWRWTWRTSLASHRRRTESLTRKRGSKILLYCDTKVWPAGNQDFLANTFYATSLPLWLYRTHNTKGPDLASVCIVWKTSSLSLHEVLHFTPGVLSRSYKNYNTIVWGYSFRWSVACLRGSWEIFIKFLVWRQFLLKNWYLYVKFRIKTFVFFRNSAILHFSLIDFPEKKS